MAVKKKIKFKNWINKVGINETAKLLGVKTAAVRHWRRGANLPSDETKHKIMKLTHGAVAPNEMIQEHFKKLKKA